MNMEITKNALQPNIILDNVNLYFKQGTESMHVLKDIQLTIDNGDFVCLLGPSGCGKSSLLNILAGYIRPSSGNIFVNGTEFLKPNPDVGVVFQQPNLFPWCSVRKNVEYGLKRKKIPVQERKEIVDYYLDIVGLSKFGNMLPHQLSGGMKQRAAIARTLVTNPKIVLLDEPFSALDALTREKMQAHIYSIWKKTKTSFLFITHDVEEALLLSNRILVMHPNPGTIVSDFKNPLKKTGNHFFREIRESKLFWNMRDSLLNQIQTESDDLKEQQVDDQIYATLANH